VILTAQTRNNGVGALRRDTLHASAVYATIILSVSWAFFYRWAMIVRWRPNGGGRYTDGTSHWQRLRPACASLLTNDRSARVDYIRPSSNKRRFHKTHFQLRFKMFGDRFLSARQNDSQQVETQTTFLW